MNFINNCKYIKLIEKCGYLDLEFLSLRKNHIVEFYKSDDFFIKSSSFNKNTKGFKSEFEMLKKISYLGFTPEPIKYIKINGVEILVLSYINGKILCKENYNEKIKQTILNQIEKLYNLEIIHGDIKEDNFIINNDTVHVIDFDQSYKKKQKKPFNLSEDFIGNKNKNLLNMFNRMEKK